MLDLIGIPFCDNYFWPLFAEQWPKIGNNPENFLF